jgi:hypothetical protein
VTNGVILCQYSHQDSLNWWVMTDTNRVFPIWWAWQADLVLHTGGLDDSRPPDVEGELALLRTGFSGADIVDVVCHVTSTSYSYGLERQNCYRNGTAFFDGQAASASAWGGFAGGVSFGLYVDGAHLTSAGYASFSDLLWRWMSLTGRR